MSQELQSGLLLLGVGGGGCRLAASVLAAYGGRMRALGVDTDALSNRQAAEGGLTCLLLGGTRLAGHGTGGDAIKGRLAAQDDLQNLTPHLQGVRTVVLTACLGSGTGGGATPEIIKALHDMGIATLCFVTLPFGFEGETRRKAAERVLPMIEEHADSLVVIALDDVYSDSGAVLLEEAVRSAESQIASGITLLWRLVTKPGFIQTDPERLHAMVVRGGNARFGTASAQGADRAVQVMAGLRGSRLLRSGETLSKANTQLVGILAGNDLRLAEIGEIMGKLRALCKSDCHVEMGTVLDAQFDGRVEVVVLAFESCVTVSQGEMRKESPPVQEPPVAEAFPIQPGSAKKGRSKGSKLSFGTTGRGKFQNVEPTLYNGQDLDIPTFVRRGILLDR
jgi:cell division protein FtsZ